MGNRGRHLAPLPLAALVLVPQAAQANGEVNIYSYREPGLIDPLLKAFTAKTGIKANVVYAQSGLEERMAAEGRNSPADLLVSSALVWVGSTDDARRAFLTEAGFAPDGAHRELDLHGDGTVRVKQVRLHADLTGV